MLKKSFLVLPLMIMLLPTAYANTVADYKCLNYSGNRTPFTIETMGLGSPDGDSDGKYVTFCWKASPLSYCYAGNNLIDTPAGKADYATLLTALTTGQKVNFYCDAGGYAKNIHIEQ
ncbi:Uncharacterised protein [Serratia ficaria]|uniref:hypothetical protein n=1 Tax=Serratia ficaria TaxID=61651 RepID=UPI002183782E|nr:hypothetical protein [Serratia ficaria]CAI2463951.1 Uncharacterised protein [Serratia ficaria]